MLHREADEGRDKGSEAGGEDDKDFLRGVRCQGVTVSCDSSRLCPSTSQTQSLLSAETTDQVWDDINACAPSLWWTMQIMF